MCWEKVPTESKLFKLFFGTCDLHGEQWDGTKAYGTVHMVVYVKDKAKDVTCFDKLNVLIFTQSYSLIYL